MTARRALVVGGSLGGLLAAHLLRGAGWHPSVFEGNAEELTGRRPRHAPAAHRGAASRRRVKTDAKSLLAPQIAEIFARTDPFVQPIFDLESPALIFGRVALVGDAAFVARPHVGAGATKAAIDAAVLADCLRDAGGDLKGGLGRFEHMQLPFGQDMVALSRQQGAYLPAQLKPQEHHEAAQRDVDALLHAHGTRSDQIGAIVAARGLDAYF
jgi:2-polyprenyl-6-methoxyphenol hydroxylase-like FAD-dependent oxidoreductase